MKARQGVNVPALEIACAAFTAKDIEDAEYLLQLEPPIEYIAVSFVQKGADLQELIDIMDRLDIPPEKRPKICPKIEKPQALLNLDDIMSKSGSLMVARGDLGVELGPERVPFAQKLMIKKAKEAGMCPIIVATQMMESMIKNAVPTRAEVNDVEGAVFDGADAVMLSGEAAIGDYPVETVTVMASAARNAQKNSKHTRLPIRDPAPKMSYALEPIPPTEAPRSFYIHHSLPFLVLTPAFAANPHRPARSRSWPPWDRPPGARKCSRK